MPVNHPLISVLMPVRNAAPFLNQCLDSIIRQSEEDFELIVVNNSSTDKSLSILQDYALNDNRIRVFSNPGAAEIIPALQLALSKAQGKYVTRMDADDIMLPDKLLLLKKRLEECPERTVVTGAVEIFMDDGSTPGPGFLKYQQWLNELNASENHFADIFKECVIPSPCWMMHTHLLNSIGGFDNARSPEDYDLCFRLLENGFGTAGVQAVLHRWRDYPHRNSRVDSTYFPENYTALKLHYFHKLHLMSNCIPTVIGAGKKGKTVAKWFTEKGIDFIWITGNERKQGTDIYGKILQPFTVLDRLDPLLKIIVAVSSPEEILEVSNSLNLKGYGKNLHYYNFY